MQFRGNADRRRRVLMDDRTSDESGEATQKTRAKARKSSTNNVKQAYAKEARREHQPTIIDFVPRRYWTLSLLLLTGLCAIAATESMYALTRTHSRVFSQEELATFNLLGTSTLTSWLSSLLLGISATISIIIFKYKVTNGATLCIVNNHNNGI